MTVSPSTDKKGAASNVSARAADGEESAPSYEQATQQDQVAQPAQQPPRQLYPFPTFDSHSSQLNQATGQQGDVRVPIAPAAHAAHPTPNYSSGGALLPSHQRPARRGPRAGRRFCAAFFWAIVLYVLLGMVMGIIYGIDEENNPPSAPSPPGWHHHHGGHGHRGGKTWQAAVSLPTMVYGSLYQKVRG